MYLKMYTREAFQFEHTMCDVNPTHMMGVFVSESHPCDGCICFWIPPMWWVYLFLNPTHVMGVFVSESHPCDGCICFWIPPMWWVYLFLIPPIWCIWREYLFLIAGDKRLSVDSGSLCAGRIRRLGSHRLGIHWSSQNSQIQQVTRNHCEYGLLNKHPSSKKANHFIAFSEKFFLFLSFCAILKHFPHDRQLEFRCLMTFGKKALKCFLK